MKKVDAEKAAESGLAEARRAHEARAARPKAVAIPHGAVADPPADEPEDYWPEDYEPGKLGPDAPVPEEPEDDGLDGYVVIVETERNGTPPEGLYSTLEAARQHARMVTAMCEEDFSPWKTGNGEEYCGVVIHEFKGGRHVGDHSPETPLGEVPPHLAKHLDGLDEYQVCEVRLLWHEPEWEPVFRGRMAGEATNRYGAVIDALKKMREAQWSWVADRCGDKGLPIPRTLTRFLAGLNPSQAEEVRKAYEQPGYEWRLHDLAKECGEDPGLCFIKEHYLGVIDALTRIRRECPGLFGGG